MRISQTSQFKKDIKIALVKINSNCTIEQEVKEFKKEMVLEVKEESFLADLVNFNKD